MSHNREWMYINRFHDDGGLNSDFLAGLETFIEFASSRSLFMDGNNIKCPCKKCDNVFYKEPNTVRYHIAKFGFVQNYYTWRFQGETSVGMADEMNLDVGHKSNVHHTVVTDAHGPLFNMGEPGEKPNPEAQRFYDMLNAANKELWPGCSNHSQLSFMARLMSLKSESTMAEKCSNQILKLVKESVPEDNLVPDDFYSMKKLLHGMGLPVVEIDCCISNCMIYWREDIELVRCKVCGQHRFKSNNRESSSQQKKQVAFKKMLYFPLTPRLQRLYASKATAENMRWHASSCDDGVMRHPADSPAWKHLNMTYPVFASEIRNVRLGLSINGFQPLSQLRQRDSSWAVVVTPYNLPPSMCMKEEYMFLTILVSGPRNPKEDIDVFLQPLISELTELWEVGVLTYDVSLKQNFQMHAAVIWTIGDFHAYSMLSGWGTAGRLACPHCMKETDAFTLTQSCKFSWFDNHRKFLPYDHPFRKNKKAFRKNTVISAEPLEMISGEKILNQIDEWGLVKVTKMASDPINGYVSEKIGTGWKRRSILWDLPYWSSLLIRHNLDVIQIEKNVFDSVFNTVLNVQGKTKDTRKSREELNLYCYRPGLEVDESTRKYPKASYMLDNREKKVLCEWIKSLRFSDGYISNLSKCVDMSKLKMFGMNDHKCHVFLQRILPIAFRELLPQNVWKSITELSLFFKDLTSRNIKTEDMCRLHENIAIILCKLERIFPPSFFNCMEHLPVHLADEARIAGPVQYRWLYPFERYLRKLKIDGRDKARIEDSICNAYLVKEASTLCSYYFEEHMRMKRREVHHNCDGRGDIRYEDHPDMLSIFKQSGQPFGEMSKRYLDEKELAAAHLYVLLNCTEVTDLYYDRFVETLKISNPSISQSDIEKAIKRDFAPVLAAYVKDPLSYADAVTPMIRELATGPSRLVKTYPGFYVNGYKFQTLKHGTQKATMNSGVCIKGEVYGNKNEPDYYGRLLEVCELEYPRVPVKTITMFKCEWFDTSKKGTLVHPDFKLVSVNHTRRYKEYEPFVLASQATQVHYCPYPSLNESMKDWWAVCEMKARADVEVLDKASSAIPPPFQEDKSVHIATPTIDDDTVPVHPDGTLIDIEEAGDKSDEDIQLPETDDDDDEDDDDDDSDY
ncbi:uncharacterized protein LOC131024507 [Salvia miltiorrhiza]|uniref:uncharacterized protein LOC131024507 n=1 Tax=Salvia miltiorrhiza TaxID=226208 RepID=UPI0025AD8F80|nr:uncharacterized protein LOC131024507 [Salvia miltiorrhiza]